MLGDLGIWPAQDHGTAVELAHKALAIADARRDTWGRGRALHLLGDVAHHTIDYDTSQRLYGQSLAISRAIGDRWSEGANLNMLGEVAYTLGDYAGAEQLYRESIALGEAVGDRNNLVWCMDRLADVIALQGRYADARAIALQGIELGRKLGSRSRVAYGLLAMVEIATASRTMLRRCVISSKLRKRSAIRIPLKARRGWISRAARSRWRWMIRARSNTTRAQRWKYSSGPGVRGGAARRCITWAKWRG